ncbi:hypothetical protein [Halorubrum ezzemoulense]|nr:hypothetical protein [Halorubrum ezzemoulense]
MERSTYDGNRSSVFHIADHGPCYVPDRTGNDEYVKAADSDYDFG